MPTSPSQRNTRSRSNSLDDVKSEIITAFKEELNQVSMKLDTLIKRVKDVEESVSSILKTQERQGAEIDSLKEALARATAEKLSVFDEIEDRDRRRTNLIISGLEEKDGSVEERKEWDKSNTVKLLTHLGIIAENAGVSYEDVVTTSYRVGRHRPDGNRLLKVVCKDQAAKKDILGKAKELRSNSTYRNVYINPDLTPMQQEESKRLRTELRSRRDKGEDVIIRRGKIISRSLQNFH